MAPHPKHPKCEACGRALYKNLPGGKPPKKGDPWKYCRNSKCATNLQPVASEAVAQPSLPEVAPVPTEPEAVKKARVRIREILFRVIPGQFDASTVGVALALVSQETGNHAAANALIAEYSLTEKYGIQPVDSK
jgi:hypothetical protein